MHYTNPARRKLIRVKDILNRRIFVYGKGTGFDTLRSFVLAKFDIQVVGVIDKRFDKPTVLDSILHGNLSVFTTKGAIGSDDVVIVSIGSQKIFQELKMELMSRTGANVVWALDIWEYHLSHTSPIFLDTLDEFLRTNREIIASTRELYEDEKSRFVFDGVMNFFSTNEITEQAIPRDPLSTQYFPNDFSLPRGNARFINGGAYDGDTLRSMITNLGSLGEKTVCFEPDLVNYGRLTENLSQLPESVKGEVVCLPLGLGENCQRLRFRSGSSVNSAVDLTGSEELTVVSIDQALPNFDPTFINMDIEGSEEQALRGAIRTISKSKPDLAICVYHSLQQFLAIPNFLSALNFGYRFRLRNYTGFPAETVLYATALNFLTRP